MQVGARPDIANALNSVPITQVSRIVIAAAFHLDAAIHQPLGVAQVTSHPRLTLNEWMGALDMYSYDTPMVPYREWATKTQEYVGGDAEEDHALLPLFHFVVGDLLSDTVAPELDDANAVQALRLYDKKADSERDLLAGSAVSIQSLGMYLAYLVAIGFLPAPPNKGAYELPSLDGGQLEALAAGRVGGRSARP